MKIVEMHIYGYGQLENIKITNLADFQVFYGENEAGKSTIMAFIHAIFFGFPTKQQLSELRYEPKHNSNYGGKIKILHEDQGYGIIERVKGKASGDVRVVMESGKIGGEEILQELLSSFDKSLFQAIFSFNLHGLQNIHQMRGEDIGKFLFSAGTLGTERLSKTESILQKELEFRFKPSGKKPLLNEKLQTLHELNHELKKASNKNKEYEILVEKKESLKQEMQELTRKLKIIQEKEEKLNEWKRIESIVKEQKWTENELEDIGVINFPVSGIERLEKLNQVLHPYNAEVISISARMENVKKEIINLQPDYTYLENESTIQAWLDQVPFYEQLKLEKQQYEMKLSECEENLAETKEKLHLSLEEEEVLSINTNIYMKNQVELVANKRKKLIEIKQELEETYQEEKDTLEEIEKEVRLVQKQVLSVEDRSRLEELANDRNEKQKLEWQLKGIQDKMVFYRQVKTREKDSMAQLQKQKRILLFIFELIFAALTLYGVIGKQWLLVVFGVLGCIVVAMFMTNGFQRKFGGEVEQTLRGLIEEEQELMKKLQSTENLHIKMLAEKLKLDNQLQEQLNILRIRHKQQQNQLEKIIVKFEEWERQEAQNKQSIVSICKELKIPEYMANSFLLDALQLIEQLKSLYREKRQFLLRLEQIQQEQMKISEGILSLAKRHMNDSGLDLHKASLLLRERIKEEHEKQIKSQEKKAKLEDLEADLQQKIQAQQHVQSEYNKLLLEAKVETEQQYYELGKRAEKQKNLQEKLNYLLNQLQFSILSKQEQESYLALHQVDELETEYHGDVLRIQALLKKLQEEHASTKYEIQMLEEGGVYSEVLHHFKESKFELDESAKEWSVYCLAQEMLARTVEKYKNVQLPRMLSKAEEFLSFLTKGKYQKIYTQDSGIGFFVEREDHTLFEANELSQATTEQLYVSIRLALATTLYEKYPFPIIIDDSFVNFDAERTNRMIELLKTLNNNQILFFTCHGHLLNLFPKEHVLSLRKGVAQIL